MSTQKHGVQVQLLHRETSCIPNHPKSFMSAGTSKIFLNGDGRAEMLLESTVMRAVGNNTLSSIKALLLFIVPITSHRPKAFKVLN